MKSISINFFLAFLIAVLLVTMLNNHLFQSSAVQAILYLLQILFISYLVSCNSQFGVNVFNNKKNLICLCVIVFGMLVFYKQSPLVGNVLKFFGYISCFYLGLNFEKYDVDIKPKSLILNMVCFLPLLIVGIFDHSLNQSMFFPNSNTFVYWGGCCALLYYTLNNGENKAVHISAIILLLYVLVGSSLGIVAALLLSIIIINRRNKNLMVMTIVMAFVFYLLVLYSSFSIFARIRNVIEIYKSMSLDDWLNLKELELWTLQNDNAVADNMRSDNTSSIWRLQHWLRITDDFFTNWMYSFLIGLGDNYTKFYHHLKPHNDFLRVLIEYGGVVFFVLISYIKQLFSAIRNEKCFYFILPLILYHLTENLIDGFPSNCLFYFCTGYWYYKCIVKTAVI